MKIIYCLTTIAYCLTIVTYLLNIICLIIIRSYKSNNIFVKVYNCFRNKIVEKRNKIKEFERKHKFIKFVFNLEKRTIAQNFVLISFWIFTAYIIWQSCFVSTLTYLNLYIFIALIPLYTADVLYIQNNLTRESSDQKGINYFFETLIVSSLVTILLGIFLIKPTMISMIELAQFIIGSILIGFIVEDIENITIRNENQNLNYKSTNHHNDNRRNSTITQSKKSSNLTNANLGKKIKLALFTYGICLSLLFLLYLSLSSLKDKISNYSYTPTINQFENFANHNSKKNLMIYKNILDDALKNKKKIRN